MAMDTTLQTRKPVEALTPEDLATFPIWEFATGEEGDEEQDETWIRPLERSTIPREADSLSVAADFVTADGTPFVGIVALSTDEEIEFGGASLLSNGAYIYAAHGEKTPLRYKTSTASELGKPPAGIYPLRFTLRALLEGEAAPRSGIFA
jgi:hypothetical protein